MQSTAKLMQRKVTEEILDSPSCPPDEIETSLGDIAAVNRRFGGVRTTRLLIERVAVQTGQKHFSLLEVGSARGELPRAVAQQLAAHGVTLDITDLDRSPSHLQRNHRALAADALALPFRDSKFDLVSCNLFAHHLEPEELQRFADEALRVSRYAVLINDLIRHPLHLALVYAGFPLMRSYVSRLDGVASVKRSYTQDEMWKILSANDSGRKIEISRHCLFRMGVILWK
jgi:ubiquinone/menaquinone biosynthesis C-methylase UbiE